MAAGVLADELSVATEDTAKWLYESSGDGAARRADRVAGLEARLAQLWNPPSPPSTRPRLPCTMTWYSARQS